MKRKHRRLWIVISALAGLGAVVALVLVALEDSIVFFYGPSELVARAPPAGQRLRIGGLVVEGSVKRAEDGVSIRFEVTDLAHAVPVVFRGMLPDLFSEGQGVVAEGALDADGVFVASQVLAKHDESYMPPEVAEALKKSGKWKGGTQ